MTSAPPTGERAAPYFCPYCADEDLRPHGTTPGHWHCRACLRTFRLQFLGVAPTTGTEPTTSPTGGSR